LINAEEHVLSVILNYLLNKHIADRPAMADPFNIFSLLYNYVNNLKCVFLHQSPLICHIGI